jgi:hypothetical protein
MLRDSNFREDFLSGLNVSVNGKDTYGLTDNSPATYSTLQVKDRITIRLQNPTTLNAIQLGEAIEFGQHVRSFTVTMKTLDEIFSTTIHGTTIGHKRILVFPTVKKISLIEIVIDDANSDVVLNGISAFHFDENLLGNE